MAAKSIKALEMYYLMLQLKKLERFPGVCANIREIKIRVYTNVNGKKYHVIMI